MMGLGAPGPAACVAGLLLALPAASAGAGSPAPVRRDFSYEEARVMPPAALARRIFGDRDTPVIDAVEWDIFLGINSLTLLEPAVRRGQLCARRIHFVGLARVDGSTAGETARTRLRVSRLDSETRLGMVGATGACPALEHGYTYTYQIGEARTAAVLGRLSEARAAAAAAAPPPFRINCRTAAGEADRCGGGGRAVLAGLTFEDLAWVNPVWTSNCGHSVFGYEGGPCPARPAPARVLLGWQITLRHAAGELSWVIGIGEGEHAGTVEMEARWISFH